jgi:hypothetical protein
VLFKAALRMGFTANEVRHLQLVDFERSSNALEFGGKAPHGT